MIMGFKADFNMNDILKNHENIINNILENIANQLELTMRELVEAAKLSIYAQEDKKYKDRTGNLRQSVGFVIFHNGELIRSSFQGGGEGNSTGLEIAKDAANESNNNGFVCVLVAGMEYARYVENKGFDVITGSWLHFDEYFQKAMKDLEFINFSKTS